MPGSYVLAVDLGSSGLRAVLVPADRPWEIEASVERRYRTFGPRSPEALWRRFSPEELRRRLFGAVSEALASSGVVASDITAVSIGAQRGGTAFLAADGTTVYLAPNTDLRAVFEGAAIDDRLSGEVYARTGHLPSFFFTPAKLAWWREHHPRASRRIAKLASLSAWAVHQLTGELAEVPSTLSEAGLLDIGSRTYAQGLLGDLGVGRDLLPFIVSEGTPTAGVRADVAKATGLPSGTPVYLAGPDTQLAMLGAGVASAGDVGVAAGWSAPVQIVTAAPAFDEQWRTWAGLHVVPERWIAEASAGDTGGTLEVVRRLLGPRAGVARIDALAARSRIGANQLMAFWGPHALNLGNPGMEAGGLIAPVPITHNAVHAGHLVRATLENIAYAIRACVELATEVAGSRAPRTVALTGGMAASNLFPQMLADVLNTPVRRHHPRAGAMGAAIVASRPPAEWPAAARTLALHGKTADPDVRGVVAYGELYERWQHLRQRLAGLTDDL